MAEIDYAFYSMFFVIAGVVGILLINYITKFSGTKQKRAVKTVKEENVDAIVQSYANSIEVLKEQNEFLVAENKTIKKRLAAEIGVNLKAEQSEIATQQKEIKITDNNLEEHYEIDVTNGVKLVKSMNLPFLNNMDESKIPALINNPMIKGKVWKYIKENKDEMIQLGVIIPKGTVTETKQEEKPKEESNNGMLNLAFDNSNAKHMA